MSKILALVAVAGLAAAASADFIDFESDPVGAKPNGWMSVDSTNVEAAAQWLVTWTTWNALNAGNLTPAGSSSA